MMPTVHSVQIDCEPSRKSEYEIIKRELRIVQAPFWSRLHIPIQFLLYPSVCAMSMCVCVCVWVHSSQSVSHRKVRITLQCAILVLHHIERFIFNPLTAHFIFFGPFGWAACKFRLGASNFESAPML